MITTRLYFARNSNGDYVLSLGYIGPCQCSDCARTNARYWIGHGSVTIPNSVAKKILPKRIRPKKGAGICHLDLSLPNEPSSSGTTDDTYKQKAQKTITGLLRCLPGSIRLDFDSPSWELCWNELSADAQDEVEAARKKAREFLKE